jgi:hypothetical protein
MKGGDIQYELCHIADPSALTLRQITQIVAKELGIDLPKACVNLLLAKLIGQCSDILNRLCETNIYLTSERVKELAGNWGIDITKARSWNFEPRPNWQENFIKTIQGLAPNIKR